MILAFNWARPMSVSDQRFLGPVTLFILTGDDQFDMLAKARQKAAHIGG